MEGGTLVGSILLFHNNDVNSTRERGSINPTVQSFQVSKDSTERSKVIHFETTQTQSNLFCLVDNNQLIIIIIIIVMNPIEYE